MNVITVEGLAPEYRMYVTESDTYVKVKATIKDEALCCFLLSARVSDERGGDVGPEGPPFVLTVAVDQTDLPDIGNLQDSPQKGSLAVSEGVLYEGDGDDWLNRGPVPGGITPGGAEMLCELDKRSRLLVVAAERSWGRQSAQGAIKQLIGLEG